MVEAGSGAGFLFSSAVLSHVPRAPFLPHLACLPLQDTVAVTREQAEALLPCFLEFQARMEQLSSQSAASLATLRQVQQASRALARSCAGSCVRGNRLGRQLCLGGQRAAGWLGMRPARRCAGLGAGGRLAAAWAPVHLSKPERGVCCARFPTRRACSTSANSCSS